MALNNFFDIPKWRRAKRDPDAAGPIAARVMQDFQKMTRVVISTDGEIEYGEEVSLQFFSFRNLDLTTALPAARRPPQFSNTLEVRCPKGKCGSNQTVVLAGYPYGYDWFGTSRLKPGRYYGRRRDPAAVAVAEELILKLRMADDPQAVLEASEFDPFETSSKMLVARFLNSYERTPEAKVTVRNWRPWMITGSTNMDLSTINKVPRTKMSRREHLRLFLSSHLNVPNPEPLVEVLLKSSGFTLEEADIPRDVPPHMLCGLCEDFDECRNRLRNCEQAREWIANPERTLSNSDAREERPYALEGEAAEKFFSAVAEHVWEASIVKALAGVVKEETYPNERRIRRLVIDAVVRIYRDSMFNLARRLRGSRRPVFGQDGRDFVDQGNQEESSERSTSSECEEAKWKEHLERLRPSQEEQKRLLQKVRAWLRVGTTRDIVEACGLLAAATATMTVPADIVAKLRQITRDQSNWLEASAAAYALKRITAQKRRDS